MNKENPNCIVRAFDNKDISIFQESSENKINYYFKASDVAKLLDLTNIAVSIQNYEEDEKVLRKAYDLRGCEQDTTFLTSRGIYRLLYNSKKPLAKKFRKWVGDILDDIIFNQSKLLKEQLDNNQKLLEEKDKRIELLENKPDTRGFNRDPGYVYAMVDTSKKNHVKIGNSDNDKRENALNCGSSTNSIKILKKFYTYDKYFAESIIHKALNPFRIKLNNKTNEWFYFKDDLEMNYMIKVCQECVEFINKYNIIDYNDFKEKTKNLENEIINDCKINEIEEISNIKENTSKFIGVYFNNTLKKWIAQKTIKNKKNNIGYFNTEFEAGIAYNDYILYLNNTYNKKYKINNIENYVPNPRNIIEENKKKLYEKKTSFFRGVHYNNIAEYYIASITFNKEAINLGCNHSELECAKIYNQQALYFNNKYNTNFILNEIHGYITIAKDIHTEIKENYINRKSSKWIGVSVMKCGKYRSCLTYKDKQYCLGTFESDLEAGKKYNNFALYLNETYNEKYILNAIPNYITIPENVPEDNKNIRISKFISKYSGVSNGGAKNLFRASVSFKNKVYICGYNNSEIECAKLYNQQVMYFNENFNTVYKLNDIPGYTTIAKNVNEEYIKRICEKKKLEKIINKYVGVKSSGGNYISSLIFNKKKLIIGKFSNEIDAVKAYNTKAIELNEQYDKRYIINII